jgi:hypothetical protein
MKWLLLFVALASNVYANSVLIVDPTLVEAKSAVVARVTAQAGAMQLKKTGKAAPLNAQYAEALEATLSDFRAGLPKAVAELAVARKADIVVEASVAKLRGIVAPDISADVAAALDKKLIKLAFIAP